MAHKVIDRCKETTSSTGTGNLTLTGAVSGFVAMASALTSNGDTSWFCAENGTEWEVFLGTRVSATELARTTVLSSSNSGSAVSFTAAPGAAPWTIRSADGAVDLRFQPHGERAEDVNFLILSSRYRQPFGSFSGRLRDARGREVRIDGVPGVTEEHAALW